MVHRLSEKFRKSKNLRDQDKLRISRIFLRFFGYSDIDEDVMFTTLPRTSLASDETAKPVTNISDLSLIYLVSNTCHQHQLLSFQPRIAKISQKLYHTPYDIDYMIDGCLVRVLSSEFVERHFKMASEVKQDLTVGCLACSFVFIHY